MSGVVMHSEVPVDPEHREEAMATLAWMARESRAEDGVVDYRVTVDIESPNTLRIVEEYESEAAADAHESSEHLDEFVDRIDPYLAEEAVLHRFAVAEKTTLPGP